MLLATDGDFNVGVTGDGGLVGLVEKHAKSNVFLTVLGFGAVKMLSKGSLGSDPHGRRAEFVGLIEKLDSESSR